MGLTLKVEIQNSKVGIGFKQNTWCFFKLKSENQNLQLNFYKPLIFKVLILLIFNLKLSICFSQFNPQSKSIAEKFFPELELDISTPAFQKTSGFTNYKEMLDWLDKTIKPHTELVNLQNQSMDAGRLAWR